MKNLLIFVLSLLIISCDKPAGTLQNVDAGENDSIEVFRYYFKDGEYVYISRFKNQSNVVTTTWNEKQGKQTVVKSNTTIDSDTECCKNIQTTDHCLCRNGVMRGTRTIYLHADSAKNK